MRKKLFLIILIICLFLPISAASQESKNQQPPPTSLEQQLFWPVAIGLILSVGGAFVTSRSTQGDKNATQSRHFEMKAVAETYTDKLEAKFKTEICNACERIEERLSSKIKAIEDQSRENSVEIEALKAMHYEQLQTSQELLKSFAKFTTTADVEMKEVTAQINILTKLIAELKHYGLFEPPTNNNRHPE